MNWGNATGTRDEGAVAPADYDIPRFVVAEAIINGIAHRDYSNTGSLQVELFPDKLVVMSPGSPHPLIDISKLDRTHKSYPVNPLIAEALYQTGHIERLGTGLEDLFRACDEVGLPKPKIEVFTGEFRITIFRKKTNKKTNLGERTENTVSMHLAESSQLVLDAILKMSETSIANLARVTNLSVEGVRYQIRKLKGLVGLVHVGPDKGGHWEVVGK